MIPPFFTLAPTPSRSLRTGLSLTLLLLLFSCNPSSNAAMDQQPVAYTISGTIDSLKTDDGQVMLSTYDPVTQRKTGVDTTLKIIDGKYTLKYMFSEADLYRVDFPGGQSVMLAIDKGQSAITLNVEGKRNGKVEIIGSPDSEILQAYEAFRQESNTRLIQPAYAAMRAATQAEDQAGEVAAVEAYALASEEHRAELIDFTEKNMGTSVALYGSMLRWTGDDNVSKLEKLVSDFKAVHPDLHMTAVMEDKVNRYKKVAIGAKAPAISQADSSGNMISLADAKGTYTLIDFWASWCGPCLLQMPDLHEAYDTYREKGFEIYSVSVDNKEDKWKASIRKYKMNWPNVSDLKGWESSAAKDYNATFIPFNLLIDQEGTIIAKNLHSKSLQSKLESLLNFND